MIKHAFIGVVAGVLGVCSPAFAQGAEEVVVTGTRIEAFESLQIPHVFMKRRPDFAIIVLAVRSDTRDLSQRQEEIRQALRGLQSRARPNVVALALYDDEAGVVREFTVGAAEQLIRADRRPDSSMVSLSLRTPVGAQDTIETLNARVDQFVAAAAKPGRVEMETGDMELTLVDPEQYRQPLLQQIAADGKRVADMLGPGYGVSIDGMGRQVGWRRTGDLELTLFIPYGMTAAPQAR